MPTDFRRFIASQNPPRKKRKKTRSAEGEIPRVRRGQEGKKNTYFDEALGRHVIERAGPKQSDDQAS